MASKTDGLIQKISNNNITHSIASTAYGICETAAAEPAKTVEMIGFTLLEGTTIHIKFTYNNTVNSPTLNVNNTGAKPIVQYGTTATGTSSSTSGWYAGAVVSFTYDGTSWVRDQGFNTNQYHTSGSWNGLTYTATAINGADELEFTIPDNYGDTKNPYASKTKNYVLAAPSNVDGAPSFRELVSADIPNLSWNKITSDKPTTLSGYGITDAVKTVTSTNNAIVRFDGTSGAIQNSGVTIDDDNIITASASGHLLSGIRFYTHTATAGKTHVGWVKFAKIDLNDSNHFGQVICDIFISRSYNSPSPETYNIRVMVGWLTPVIYQLGSAVGGQIIDQFRVVQDTTNHEAYFEYHVKETASSSNTVYIKVIKYNGSALVFLN